MADLLEAARYSRRGFSLCLDGSARRVMVPGGSMFHLEPGTIQPCWNLLVPDVFDALWISRKWNYFRFVIEGGVIFSAVIPPV